MGPGFPNPFNLDLNEIMRMLQSPGPVNMEVARRTAEAMANVDDETGEPRTEPPIGPEEARAFDDVVRAVQLMVTEATGISGALTVPVPQRRPGDLGRRHADRARARAPRARDRARPHRRGPEAPDRRDPRDGRRSRPTCCSP